MPFHCSVIVKNWASDSSCRHRANHLWPLDTSWSSSLSVGSVSVGLCRPRGLLDRPGRWPPQSYPSWHVVLYSTVAAVAVGADAADCWESLAPLSIGFRSGSQVYEGSPSSRCGFSDGYKLRPDG